MENATLGTRKRYVNNLCEEMFGDEKIKNNKRISRLLIFMSILFQKVDGPKQTEFMMQPLISMKNTLRIETRNYLEAKKESDSQFRTASPLVESNE